MTNKQISDAIEMHNSGVSWSIIAAYYEVSTNTLMKHRKDYGTTSNKVQSITA